MHLNFRKMHGAGNDFVIVDTRGRPNLTEQEARVLADRRLGIGCDQVIGLETPQREEGQGPDIFMRIRNPDGSEAGACGNATRCVAELLREATGGTALIIRTIAGDLPATYLGAGRWSVDMGEPRLAWQDVPLADPTDTLAIPLAIEDLGTPAALSMGNPHATFFVDDLAATDIPRLGPILEHAPIFPERANIGFAQILAPDRIRLRVWERGAGLTLACGSGACAALVNAARRGQTARAATLLLDGGELRIEWRADAHVIMTGPTATAFTGSIDLAAIDLAA
jgi:diaminopimelate epimerase